MIALAVALLLAPGLRSVNAQQNRLTGFDQYVEKSMRDWQVPGLAIAVVKDDKVVFAKGFGVRTVGGADKVDEHTLFAIGSNTKQFTSAALAMLVDEGKIKWDDPVTRYLPSFQLSDPYVTRVLTVRDLLCHRVGIERADDLWGATTFSRDDVIRRARYLKQTERFRDNFGYNNLMFIAAGQIVAAVSGMSYDEFVKKRIFEPLGMSSTNTSITAFAGNDNVATPHALQGGKVSTTHWRNIDHVAAAGSINSNVVDMAQWLRMQLGDGMFEGKRLISKASIDEMRSPQNIIPYPGEDWQSIERPFWPAETHFMLYGMGWFLQDYRGRKVVWHGGSIDGMAALVSTIPEEHLGVVCLTNLNSAVWDQLNAAVMFRVFDAYLGAPERDWSTEILSKIKPVLAKYDEHVAEEQKRTEGTKPSLSIGNYSGVYLNCAMGLMRVTYQSGKLQLQGPVYAGPMEHWQYDTFKVSWTDPDTNSPDTALATFSLDEHGKVESMKIGGRIYTRVSEGAEDASDMDPCRLMR